MTQNDEFLYQLRIANPIDAVVGSYVNLIKRGHNFVCSCPFHSEKTPSCTVYTDTQSFYCFGCGSGGDVITFIMKIENLDFREAINFLAARAGLTVPEDKKNSQYAQRKTRIYEINRFAANFYYKNLLKGTDKRGLKYFAERKLSPQTVKKYGLGFAPDSFDLLYSQLRKNGYNDDEIFDSWLCTRSQKNGKIYDIFRNRVMFPIIDLRGNVIGFGGRVLDDSKPKYLNTSKTPVFDKGNNLFSMNFAKNSPEKRIILAEGYMDVIAINQAGFENVVATLGTAITPEQARLLSHYVNEVIIAYDSDAAGQNATQKAINHFSNVGINTRIIRLEGAKDPDEYIKKFGAAKFRMLLDDSFDANNFMLNQCENGIDLSTQQGQVEFLNRASKILAKIESPLEREVYISRTVKKCDISADILKSHIDNEIKKSQHLDKKLEWKNITAASVMPDKVNPMSVKLPKECKAEENIICWLLKHPENCSEIAKKAPPELFVTDFNKKIYDCLLRKMTEYDSFTISMLSEEFSTEEVGRITGIEAKKRSIDISEEVFADCIAILQNYHKSPHFDNGENISDNDLVAIFENKRKRK
ncbi:MAG: DNA primase [Ruminococcus sp.]|nr:DNA primase [Ruminococcus sp.]MBR6670092.1 DNA primase [Ruminococcus sp.]